MIQTHANLFLFLGNKSEAACYRAPAVALEFAHRNFWPVAYVSVNFSQEVAVVNILVRCCEHLSGLTEAVKICCGADFTERASVFGGHLNVSSGWPRDMICIVVL